MENITLFANKDAHNLTDENSKIELYFCGVVLHYNVSEIRYTYSLKRPK